MPKILTVEEAVNIADGFIRKYYPFMLLEKVIKDNETWVVEFDVGAVSRRIVRVKLDASTGQIIEYIKV